LLSFFPFSFKNNHTDRRTKRKITNKSSSLKNQNVMQQITGRLTADATVKNLESGKQVVNFSIAENQSYTPKGGETVNVPTYFNCSYWLNTAVAKVLRKGAVVQLNGRVSARAYQSNTGDLGASLDFLTNRLEVLAYAQDKSQNSPAKDKQPNSKGKSGKKQNGADEDDLPF